METVGNATGLHVPGGAGGATEGGARIGPALWQVAMPVADLGEALEFYCERLGFELIGAQQLPTRRLALVGMPGCTCRLELYQPIPATQQSLRGRPDHLAFDCADIDAWHGQLVEAGLNVPAVAVNGHGLRQFSVIDPNGTLLEFYEGRQQYENSIAAAMDDGGAA